MSFPNHNNDSKKNQLVLLQAQRHASTDLAILVGPTGRFVSDRLKTWLPLGLVTDLEALEPGSLDADGQLIVSSTDIVNFYIPRWLMDQKGLEDYECDE